VGPDRTVVLCPPSGDARHVGPPTDLQQSKARIAANEDVHSEGANA
jgi:hypothetical protein